MAKSNQKQTNKHTHTHKYTLFSASNYFKATDGLNTLNVQWKLMSFFLFPLLIPRKTTIVSTIDFRCRVVWIHASNNNRLVTETLKECVDLDQINRWYPHISIVLSVERHITIDLKLIKSKRIMRQAKGCWCPKNLLQSFHSNSTAQLIAINVKNHVQT